MPSRPLALRFVWGQLQGGSLPLDRGRSLVVGRDVGSDLVLADDLVSRRHAQLAFEGDDLLIEDLGSTNGTYVNGERVSRVRLAEGDRLLLGGSILRVVARGPVGEERNEADGRAQAQPQRGRAMQGRLEDVPLLDLLQLFASSHKSGLLTVEGPDETAELELDAGCASRCTLTRLPEASLEKCFYRILGWTQGHFELGKCAAREGGPPPQPLEPLLLEGMRQADELKRLLPELPSRLSAGASPPDDLAPDLRAILAVALERSLLQDVLDASPLPDFTAAEKLRTLLERGLLVGEGA